MSGSARTLRVFARPLSNGMFISTVLMRAVAAPPRFSASTSADRAPAFFVLGKSGWRIAARRRPAPPEGQPRCPFDAAASLADAVGERRTKNSTIARTCGSSGIAPPRRRCDRR